MAVAEVDNISNSSVLSGIQYGPIYFKYSRVHIMQVISQQIFSSIFVSFETPCAYRSL